MKNSFYAVCLSLIFFGCAGTFMAQKPKSGETSVRFENGLKIVFTSETDPPDSRKQVVGSIQISGEKNVIHRSFIDAARGVYFGYDVEVEFASDSQKVKLTFKPLSITPSVLKVPSFKPGSANPQNSVVGGTRSSEQANEQKPVLTALSLPNYADPQIVQNGETLALDVLVNSQTGVKIIDLIKVLTSGEQQPPPFSQGNQAPAAGSSGGSIPPKDFEIDAVDLKMTTARLLVNGQSIISESAAARPGLTGALLWFYLPRHGRFILSLMPQEGYNFLKAGTIRGNKISFSINGDRYEWFSVSPVVSNRNDTWNLWVLPDPDYAREIASDPGDAYLFGSASRAEYLIKKK